MTDLTMQPVRSIRYRLLRHCLVAVALAVAGFVLNLAPVYVAGGLYVFIGQIPPLACALVLGPVYALVAAIGAVAGLHASTVHSGMFVSNSQFITWTLLLLEAVVVADLARRRRPVSAMLLYWGAFGAPTLAAFMLLAASLPAAAAALVVGKNALSGLMNVSIAALVVGRSPLAVPPRAGDDPRQSLASRLNSSLSSAVVIPALMLFMIYSYYTSNQVERGALVALQNSANHQASIVSNFLIAQRNTVLLIARTAESGIARGADARNSMLQFARTDDSTFISLLIADSTGTVLAAHFGSTESAPPLRVRQSVNARTYFTEPMRTGQPYLSGVFRGKGFGRDLIAALSAPLFSSEGRPIGIVEGSLNLAVLRSVISPLGLATTVLDQTGQVVVSTAARYRSFAGSRMPDRGVRVLADRKLLTSQREIHFAVARSFGGWSVVVETPRRESMRFLAEYNAIMLLIFAALLISIIAAIRVVTHSVIEPLVDLQNQIASLDWTRETSEPPTSTRTTARTPKEIAVVRDGLRDAARRLRAAFAVTESALTVRDAALRERDETVRGLDRLVEERTEELQVERDLALRASRAKSDFLANMSHELRTPLSVVIGRSESLADGVYGALTSRQLSAFAEIDSQSRHLLALIGDILDLARIENGRVQLVVQSVALVPLVDARVQAFRDLALSQGVALTLKASVGDWVVPAEPMRLGQILSNLLANALKFTPAGGRVVVTVESGTTDGVSAVVHVADTGIGIPPDQIERVFEPFVQADASSTRSYEGVGLGLAISHGLAKAMGARISVTSALGVGSTFSVSFEHASTPTAPNVPADTTGDNP